MSNIKGYDEIVGYKQVKAMLKQIAKSGRSFNSYIISGDKGSGKETLASIFAMSLLCEKGTGEPCFECKSCKQVLASSNPDLIYVSHEKPDAIGVDDIRTQVVDDVVVKPFNGKYKIYIIRDAHLMTTQAQNALLKTLEEPPEYVVIILLAESQQLLLPTIISRCNSIALSPLSDSQVKDYLVAEMQISEEEATIYASMAMGRIGTAKELVQSKDFNEKINRCVQILKNSKDMDNTERIELAKKLSGDRKEVFEYLDIFTVWFRDVLYFKATKESENLVFKAERAGITKRAQVSSYEGLQKILDAIHTAKMRLKSNVNASLTLELLLLKISEN